MADAQFRAEAVFFAVLRCQNDSGFDSVHRTTDLYLFSIQKDLSACLRVNAEDRSRGLGAPRSHQSRKSDDLAFVEGKVDVADETPGI